MQNKKRKAAILARQENVGGKKSFLERAALRKSATLPRYTALFLSFGVILAHFGLFVEGPGPQDNEQMDRLEQALAEYCDEKYFEGHPVSYGNSLVAAIKHHWGQVDSRFPLIRWPVIRRGWTNKKPGDTRPPLPWLHVVLIVDRLIATGFAEIGLFCLVLFATQQRQRWIN